MSIYKKFFSEELDSNGRLVSFSYHYPSSFNFAYDVVDEIARTDGKKRAIVWTNAAGEEKIIDFRTLKEESDKRASLFLSLGVKKGDKVIVALKRHYEYWFVALALHKIGAVLIPVTHMLTEKDFRYRILKADVRMVVTTKDDDVPERIRRAIEGMDVNVIQVGSGGNDIFPTLKKMLEGVSPLGERIETGVSDPMLMYFTSGTTGEPKGVVHDFSYPLSHIVTAKYWQGATDGGLHFTLAETGWAKASWGKIYGQWLVGSAVMVYDFDSFDPGKLSEVINRFHVTSFCAPPTVYRYLVKKGIPEMPSLKHASTAGEYLHQEIFRLFKEKTGLTLAEGYGQSETALLAANFIWQDAVDGSMGTSSPLYNLRVVDKDGNEVERGEVGEIVVLPDDEGKRPVGIFSSYLGPKGMYEDAWRGGMYHTGDSAAMDENGALWFKGRADDVIKSGGFRIGPEEIEDVLITHPDVLECSVVGIPDPLRGQAVKAYVVLANGNEGNHALEREIREYANSKLAEYKWIRKLEFRKSMPSTISGKIKKKEL